MYNILVVGAGYLGSEIAREFKRRKQRVYALTRDSEKAERFKTEEIIPVQADLTRPETLRDIPPAHFIVFCAAPDESTEDGYREIYLDGIRNFLESMKNRPRPYLAVLISSTSVWKDRGGEWVDETVPADGTSVKSKILLASEHLVLNSGYPSVIFRLSGIYGPGRNRLKVFRNGVWPKTGEADGFMNMIHVRDAASAMLPLFKNSKEGSIYLGSDDKPVLRSEFCHWLSEKTKAPHAPLDKTRAEGKRCRNTEMKKLGVILEYPSFEAGYETFLADEREI